MARPHPLLRADALLAALYERLGPAGKAVRVLTRMADARNMPLWAVGGAVRDTLDPLFDDSFPRDVDLTVVGDVVALGHAACAEVGGELVTSPRFGTASWHVPEGWCIDLATARREHYAYPGALPEVSFVEDMAVDLGRRDFAINAMALGLSRDNCALLLDPCDGRKDLVERLVRVLHERSFIDDPTRLWRAARLCARRGLTPEPKTAALMHSAGQSHAAQTLSPARLGAELRLCCAENTPVKVFAFLEQWGCLAPLGLTGPAGAWVEHLRSLHAVLTAAPSWLVPAPRHHVAAALLLVLDVPPDAPLSLAAQASGLIGGAARILQLKSHLAQLAHAAQCQEPAVVAQLMSSLGAEEKVVAWVYLASGSSRPAMAHWAAIGRRITSAVTAEDLLKNGITAGPRIRLGLSAARRSAHAGHDQAQQLVAALTAAHKA